MSNQDTGTTDYWANWSTMTERERAAFIVGRASCEQEVEELRHKLKMAEMIGEWNAAAVKDREAVIQRLEAERHE